MPKKKTVLSFLLIVAMVFSIALTALADGHISTGEITITPNTDPYEYGTAPDGLYVFLYHGYNPYFTGEFDTSECELDRLYVHNQTTNEIVEISTQAVTAYTTTKDALYYITESQTIYKTDYTGRNHTALYQCTEGEIDAFSSYLELLTFIENGNKVVFVDSNTGNAQVVFAYDDLDWIFMLSDTELLIATLTEEYLIYDFSLQQITDNVSEIDAINLVNVSVLSGATPDAPNMHIMSNATEFSFTQDNDITFPLAEYPATIYSKTEVSNFAHRKPLSWFHKNGGEGCDLVKEEPPEEDDPSDNCMKYAKTGECEGFARYAHDAYMHIIDQNIGYDAWRTSRHAENDDLDFDDSIQIISQFFSTLKTGAYVRYGRDNDTIPPEGVHSIVFVASDNDGIWVYECNQSYYKRLTVDEINGKPESYFGCGVHFQYYTYKIIEEKYDFVAHYINHTFSNAKTINSKSKHKVNCTSCSGYLLQSHTGSNQSTYDDLVHTMKYACCSGSIAGRHIIVNGIYDYCSVCGWVDGLITSSTSTPSLKE